MAGVLFGEKHTENDWNLIRTSKDIGFPPPKRETVDISGMDGMLDFSTSLTNDIKYDNRKLGFEFFIDTTYDKWYALISEIANYLHGKKLKIILDDDQSFYYIGTAEINKFKTNRNIGTIVIECDVEPYKYDLTSSDEDWLWDPFDFETGIINETRDLVVDGELEVSVLGRRQKVVPKFVCENPLQLIFNEQTYNLPAGGSYSPDIEICEGENILKFIGNGTVTIEYIGGSL